MGEAMSRRIRGVFNAANFWAIVLYNVLSLNSLEFAKLVGRRIIFKGGLHTALVRLASELGSHFGES